METSLEHADERDLIETVVERSRWHCRAARETFSSDESRPVTTVLRVVAQSRNAAQHCEAQAAKSNRNRLSRVYRPPLLHDGESERTASARSGFGTSSQHGGRHKRLFAGVERCLAEALGLGQVGEVRALDSLVLSIMRFHEP